MTRWRWDIFLISLVIFSSWVFEILVLWELFTYDLQPWPSTDVSYTLLSKGNFLEQWSDSQCSMKGLSLQREMVRIVTIGTFLNLLIPYYLVNTPVTDRLKRYVKILFFGNGAMLVLSYFLYSYGIFLEKGASNLIMQGYAVVIGVVYFGPAILIKNQRKARQDGKIGIFYFYQSILVVLTLILSVYVFYIEIVVAITGVPATLCQ